MSEAPQPQSAQASEPLNATGAEVSPQLTPAPEVSSLVKTTLTRVHNAEAVPEKVFWLGHVVFVGLALVAVVIIMWARGPRRKDALVNTSSENGVSTPDLQTR
ncbi:hypothetical protein EBU99_09780 [bacterium]|nr:hypothetical protein [bacterium]